jgi:hypothetical protein
MFLCDQYLMHDNLTYKQLKGGKNDLLLNRCIGLLSFNRGIGGDCF